MKPVVKQQTQFLNKPIGVTSMRTGAPEMWQNIAASADERYREAYQYNANRSKERGEEAAAAVPTSELFVIDPNTQKPVALEPPRSFGLIGRQAYENLVNRRFEESIQGELESKAREYANKYKSSSEFQVQFAKHIENMAAPAIGDDGEMNSYGRVITELGSEYLASTTAALKKREAEIYKAKLKRHNKILRYNNTRKATVMVAEGDYVGAAGVLAEEFSRAHEEYMSGELPFTEYTKIVEQLDGLGSLQATDVLSKFYIENENQQSVIRLAIQNPEFRKDLSPEVRDDIENALLITSPANLISALESFDQDMDSYLSDQISIATANELSNVNPSTTMAEITRKTISITDEEVRSGVVKNLTIEAITQKVHASIGEVSDIGPLADELRNVSFQDTNSLREVVGDEFVAALSKLSADDRAAIASGIESRSSALNNQRVTEQRAMTQLFDAGIIELQKAPLSPSGLISRSNELIASINASDYEQKASKIDAVEQATAQALRRNVQGAALSLDEIKAIQSAIKAGTEYSGSADANMYYAAMKYSNDIAPAATSSALGSKLQGITNQIEAKTQQDIRDQRFQAIDGGYASEESVKALDEELFGGRDVPLPQLLNNPTVMNAATKGYIFPTLARSITNSFMGGTAQGSQLALETFERFQNATGVVDNEVGKIDFMRRSLSPKVYGMMNGAISAARSLGIPAAEYNIKMQSYEGDVIEDIRLDLGLSKNASIESALAEFNISKEFKSEIVGNIVARKILGLDVTEDTLSDFIDSYASNMRKDKFVVAPTIEGKTKYARDIWMNNQDMMFMRSAAMETLLQSAEYSSFFTGGTVLDSIAEGFMQLVPGRDLVANLSGQQVDEFLAIQDDRERLLAGLEILGVDLYYQPVEEAFRNGTPAYRVGYIDQNNMFEAFNVNDDFVIVSPPEKETESEELFQALNMRNKLQQVPNKDPDQRIALARSEIDVLRLRGMITTLDDIVANEQFYEELQDLLNGTGVTVEDLANGN